MPRRGRTSGVTFGKPKIELDGVRKFKDGVVGKLTKGLAGARQGAQGHGGGGQGAVRLAADARGRDQGRQEDRSRFDNCIIAAGSQSARIPGFPYDDPRLMDSTGALELEDVPKRLLIIGGGIIGLEMATVYDALGSKVTVVEFLDRLIPGADPDIVKPLAQAHREALREDPAEDQGREARGAARRAAAPPSRAPTAGTPRRRPRSTTACCSRWAAAPTARTSAPTRPAST